MIFLNVQSDLNRKTKLSALRCNKWNWPKLYLPILSADVIPVLFMSTKCKCCQFNECHQFRKHANLCIAVAVWILLMHPWDSPGEQAAVKKPHTPSSTAREYFRQRLNNAGLWKLCKLEMAHHSSSNALHKYLRWKDPGELCHDSTVMFTFSP